MNNPGAATPNGAGYTTPATPPNPQVPGTAPVINSGIPPVPNRFTVPYIFGLTEQELRAMANIDVGCYNPGAPAPPPNPCYAGIAPDPPLPLSLPSSMNLVSLTRPSGSMLIVP